jgi:ABC-type phosphate transport system substrate-binding protein
MAPPDGRRKRRNTLVRVGIYVLVVVGLLVFRVIPDLRPLVGRLAGGASQPKSLTVAGLDVAPELITRAVAEYQSLYPDLIVDTRGGGTLHAVDDLLNGRAEVAFLSRPLTAAEEGVVRSIGDSVLAFPVALGGVGVVVSESAGLDSISLEVLRGWVGDLVGGGEATPEGPHLYAPDPNTGLWGALTTALGLSAELPSRGITWLATNAEVVTAAAGDPNGVGIVSTLALPKEGADPRWHAVRVSADGPSRAAAPTSNAIETGSYPLPHYLFVSQLQSGSEHAAGFVTFLYSGRGQRWVRREGFVPAREALRQIILSADPVGQRS